MHDYKMVCTLAINTGQVATLSVIMNVGLNILLHLTLWVLQRVGGRGAVDLPCEWKWLVGCLPAMCSCELTFCITEHNSQSLYFGVQVSIVIDHIIWYDNQTACPSSFLAGILSNCCNDV